MRQQHRLERAVAAQHGRCLWCGRAFGELIAATTDHLVPRAKGGPSIAENEVAACRRCNARRGHQGPAQWAEQARERYGTAPEVRKLLLRLADRLDDVGGSRRARTYLDAQLRRC